jgi:hypothetical protein
MPKRVIRLSADTPIIASAFCRSNACFSPINRQFD